MEFHSDETNKTQEEDNSNNKTTEEEDSKKSSEEPEEEKVKSSPAAAAKNKITIILKPVGDAPIVKQNRWAVDPDKQISDILQFVRSYLKLKSENSLFFFVNQAFAPSPDQIIKNLYASFGSDSKLVLHYSTTIAWG